MSKKSICLVPESTSLGGPRTFQRNLIAWAERSGEVEVHFDADRKDIDAFLVFGGPRKYFPRLLEARRAGIPVVQRLNGINWIHRTRKTGLKYSLHAEAANLAIAFCRRFICSKIVYQSPFCRDRWNKLYGTMDKPSKVIYNGTDIRQFSPGPEDPDLSEEIEFVLAEGNYQYGMGFGIEAAVELALGLEERFDRTIRIRIAGKTLSDTEERVRERLSASGKKKTEAVFEGVCTREQLIGMERRGAFFLSTDINAACPNAVIEALGCGLPILGFDTGALKDVAGEGGLIVPYGADSWKLERPVYGPLIDAAERVIRENSAYRRAARNRAETVFPIEKMARDYISFCLEQTK